MADKCMKKEETIEQIEKRARIELLETLLDLEDSKGVITLTTRELIEIAKSYGIIVGND